MKTVVASIDRSAVRHNIKLVRELAPNCRILAVVKANAYGHGALEMAMTMDEADSFGVARIEEALKLRTNGITKPIVLLEGFFKQEDLHLIAESGLETVIHSNEQIYAIERAFIRHPLKVWLKLDSGMHRLGFRPEEAQKAYSRLQQCRSIEQPINIISHFGRADESNIDDTLVQLEIFNSFSNDKPGLKSIAASGGILLWQESHLDQVRPGIILYGVSPVSSVAASHWGFKPAMKLTSQLIAVREHKAGEPVGYGNGWISERDTKLGVIAIGYGDGYPRDAQNGTPVLINGRSVALAGRVSMDMITVDLGPDSQDRVGDEAILWGCSLPVEEIAAFNQISAYELITRLTARTEIEYYN